MATIKISELPNTSIIASDAMIPISDRDVQNILTTFKISFNDFCNGIKTNSNWGKNVESSIAAINETLEDYLSYFETIETHDEQITDIFNGLQIQEAAISTINNSYLPSISNDVLMLKTDMSTVKGDIKNINNVLNDLNGTDLAEVLENINTNAENISENTGKITSLSEKISALEETTNETTLNFSELSS